MKVHQILQAKGREVASMTGDASVADAVKLLGERRIGALVVVDASGNLEGILSERDVVKAMATHGMDMSGRKVRDLMTSEVQTCKPADDVNSVMARMTAGRFRHVPVLDGGELAGVISIGDAVKARMEELEHEREALEHYIVSG